MNFMYTIILQVLKYAYANIKTAKSKYKNNVQYQGNRMK